ncbi:hypothetical protein [Bordetella petrii]|uniref:hypothetical protein n=1 Tax=Bordetella petrii TaxID=94624 RepID=UPI003733CD11
MTPDTISDSNLKILLHAPTAAALERARSNAANVRREAPRAEVRILLNAAAVAAALDAPAHELDEATWLCPNTLRKIDREGRAPLNVLPGSSILEMARLQRAGWLYIRA